MQAAVQDRIVAGVGTVVVVAGLAVVLVSGLSVDLRRATEQALAVIDVRPPPPPPPEPPRMKPRAKNKAAPPAPRAKATPVVAPPPIVIPPKPPPIVVAPKPDLGAAARSGASDHGNGQGAGGTGNGNGGGGDGEGDGDIAPEQVGGKLKISDLPLELAAPGGEYKVGVRYYVGVDGRVGECRITQSSGHAVLDSRVCQLIQQRFRFRPARDLQGRPHGGYIIETHSFGIDRSDYQSDDGDDDRPRHRW